MRVNRAAFNGLNQRAFAQAMPAAKLSLSPVTLAVVAPGDLFNFDIPISGGKGLYLNPQVSSGAPDGLYLYPAMVGPDAWVLRAGGVAGAGGNFNFSLSVQTEEDSATINLSQRIFLASLWNHSDKASNITLADVTTGNPTSGDAGLAEGANAYGLVRSTAALTGKIYFELRYHTYGFSGNGTGSRGTAGGVCGSSLSVTTGQAYTSTDALECWGREASCWINGASLGTLSGSATEYLRIAVDVPNRKVWMALSGTTNWLGGGDPELGTSPTATLSGTDALYAFAEPYGSAAVQLISSPTGMQDSAPTGFTAGF